MEKNIGTYDRLARLILGLGALAVGAFIILNVNAWAGIIVAAAGLFLIYEAIAGWCILYRILGINTCPVTGKY
jgi:ABC-type protease/lipase transport system fused ATPase/permease subunit